MERQTLLIIDRLMSYIPLFLYLLFFYLCVKEIAGNKTFLSVFVDINAGINTKVAAWVAGILIAVIIGILIERNFKVKKCLLL